MRDLKCSYLTACDLHCHTGHERNEHCRVHASRGPAEYIQRLLDTLAGGSGPGNGQRPRSTPLRSVQKQERQASEMVAMQM